MIRRKRGTRLQRKSLDVLPAFQEPDRGFLAGVGRFASDLPQHDILSGPPYEKTMKCGWTYQPKGLPR